jgi:hypothetical protein
MGRIKRNIQLRGQNNFNAPDNTPSSAQKMQEEFKSSEEALREMERYKNQINSRNPISKNIARTKLSTLTAQEDEKKKEFMEALKFRQEQSAALAENRETAQQIRTMENMQYDLSSGEAELVPEPIEPNQNSTMDKFLKTRAFRR